MRLVGIVGFALCAVLVSAPVQGAEPLVRWTPDAPATIPFKRDTLGRVIVEGQIEGRPALIMLDSGASRALLDPEMVDPSTAKRAGTRKLNGGVRVDRLKSAQFTVGPLDVTTVLPRVYTAGDGVGILGREVFENVVVDIDFERSTVTFLPPEAFTPPPGALALATKWRRGQPTTEIVINDGQKLCAVVDLGFNGAVNVNDRAVKELRLETDPNSYSYGGMIGLEFVKREGLKPARSLAIAGHRLENVYVHRGGLDRLCGSLLGVEVLSAFRLYMDLGHDRIWLEPRPGHTFGHVLGLQYRETPTGRVVTAVRANSPATGLVLVGDIIVGVKFIDSATAEITLSTGDVRTVTFTPPVTSTPAPAAPAE